jgi:hypothetical protein
MQLDDVVIADDHLDLRAWRVEAQTAADVGGQRDRLDRRGPASDVGRAALAF